MNESDRASADGNGTRDTRPMTDGRAHMTQIVMPNDANPHGSVSGGRVLHLIDICAAVAALRHARRPVVTASFDDVAFLAPVPVGHVLLLDAQVTGVGRSSIEVRVVVRGENPITGDLRHTTTAYVTFVALDDAGRPARVPGLSAATDEDRATMERSRRRRAARLDRLSVD